MSDNYTEINLRAQLKAANDTIDMLRARLCKDGHMFVLTGNEPVLTDDAQIVVEYFMCCNCGLRHSKIQGLEEQ